MSPILERRTGIGPDQSKTLIADLPDESGTYQTLLGQITIDLSLLRPANPNSSRNIIILEGQTEVLGGRNKDPKGIRREIPLSWRGTATEQLGPNDYLDITMHQRLRNNPRHEREWEKRNRRSWRWQW